MIQWYNVQEFAKALGVCRNTFKKYYLPHIPEPTRQSGVKKWWTASVVDEIKAKVEKGELTHNSHTESQDI